MAPPIRSKKIVPLAVALIILGVVAISYIVDRIVNPTGRRCGFVEGFPLPCPGDPGAEPLVVIGLTLIAVGVAGASTVLYARSERKKAARDSPGIHRQN